MEQPETKGLTTAVPSPPLHSSSLSPPPPASKANGNGGKAAEAAWKKLSPPTPEEMVAYYEARGMEPKEASLRVIRDLQTILYRTVAPGRGKKERFVADTGRKLDYINTRLAIMEMKVDSKPGYAESFAIGVAAGAALQGIAHAVPHVVGAFGKLWDSVRCATKGHSSPP